MISTGYRYLIIIDQKTTKYFENITISIKNRFIRNKEPISKKCPLIILIKNESELLLNLFLL